MNGFQLAELSAFLDGELASDRVKQIEEMLVTDGRLREELESLRKLDVQFRAAARTAAFPISVQLPETSVTSKAAVGTVAMLVLALVVVKMAPKFVGGFAFGIALHSVALSVVLIGVIWIISRNTAVA